MNLCLPIPFVNCSCSSSKYNNFWLTRLQYETMGCRMWMKQFWCSGLTLLSRHSVGISQQNMLTHNLSGNAQPFISVCWATVNWSWPKEWNLHVQADLCFCPSMTFWVKWIFDLGNQLVLLLVSVTTKFEMSFRSSLTHRVTNVFLRATLERSAFDIQVRKFLPGT